MSAAQHHVIRREILDVAVAGTESDGFAVQRRIADLCRDWLGPALDEALARVVPAGEHWQVDRLEVELGAFGIETLERDFVAAVVAAVVAQLRDRAGGRGGALSRREPSPEERMRSEPGATSRSRRDGTAWTASRGGPPPANDDDDAARRASGGGFRARTARETLEEALVHFLETGMLPWWYRLPQGQVFEDAIRASWSGHAPPSSLRAALMRAAIRDVPRTRLVRQFSPRFLDAVLESIRPEAAETLRAALAVVARAHEGVGALSDMLWSAAFAAAASGEAPIAAAVAARLRAQHDRQAGGPQEIAGRAGIERAHFDEILRVLSAASSSPIEGRSPGAAPGSSPRDADRFGDPAPRPPPQDKIDTHTPAMAEPAAGRQAAPRPPDLAEGLFVDCAGLVLLHPFLPQLFNALDIAKSGALVAPDRALGMLHYLATGERPAPEYALVLPKHLCGLALEEPCGAPAALTDAEADEADALLKAVIGHWEALGGASVDVLRGTFLVRPGKLGRRGDDDVLQVEERSFDILLDRLPWGIGPVQLPWMRRMLWVEWRM